MNARAGRDRPLPALSADEAARTAVASAAPGSRRVYIGRWLEVPVYDMDLISPDQELKGPAIAESPTTTILLQDGDHALVTAQGWLDIAIRP